MSQGASPATPAAAAPALLGNVALLRSMLALAGPTSLVALMQVASQLTETWLAARQGTAALAGWAVILPFALLMQQMSAGAMGGGVVSAIARALGARRRDDASAMVLHAVVIALVGGLAFALGLSLFGGAMLSAIAGDAARDATLNYVLLQFGLGAIPTWLSNTLASVLRGGGRHALAARTLATAWLAYPLLSWALAEPGGMGMTGVGLAFVLVFSAACLSMALVVLRGGAGFVPDLRVRLSRGLFARILSVGATACALATLANLTTVLVTAQLRRYGTEAVAAYGISARMEFLIIPLAFGVGSALTALVGRAAGAEDWRTARRIAWLGGGTTFAVTAAFGIAVTLAPAAFAGFFTHDAGVIAIATRALHFIGPSYGCFGLGMALYFASMGAGRMKWPVFAAVSRITLAAGVGWLLAYPAGMGMDGHFIGVALGLLAYGGMTAAGVRRAVWRAR